MNFARLICLREKDLQRRFRKVSADHSDFRALLVFQAAILSVRVCRLRPSLRLETHREFEVLYALARNRILPFHVPPDPGESLAGRNSPTLRRYRTNA